MASVMRIREKWRCQVRLKGYPSLSRVFRNRTDAVAWGKWAEAEQVAGRATEEILCGFPERPVQARVASAIPTTAPGHTVGDLIRRYLIEVSPHKKSGKHDASTMRHMLEEFGRLPITALTSGALTDYKTRRLRLVSASTVTHELAMLHRAYVLAQEEWGIPFSGPIPRTRKPPQSKGRARRVSDEELDRVLAATESAELRIIARFALATAMRRGEIMAMRWEDVDLRKRAVFLPVTKNGHSRTVPLSKWAVELLQSAMPKDTGPVFTLRPDSVSQMFGYAAKRARVLDIRIHDLRHEATSRLFEKGLNQIEVSRITGHLTLSMLNHYTHLDVSHLLRKLDAAEPDASPRGGSDTAERERLPARRRKIKRGTLGRWKKRRNADD